MVFEAIEPFVRQALVADMVSHYTFKPLKTRDARLFYILSGSGEIVIEKIPYAILPGMMIVFQAGTEYQWHTQNMRYLSVNFDYTAQHMDIRRTFSPVFAHSFPKDNFSEKILFEDAPEMNEPFVGYDLALFEESLRSILTEYHLKGDFCDELLSSSLKALLIRLLRIRRTNARLSHKKSAQIVERIIEYIQMNFHKSINNQDIAQEFHFNESYINRLFKRYVGVTLHSFLLDWRISMAKQYLLDGLPVNQAAALSGFTDVCHFSKMFKKITGQTPMQYVQNHSFNG